MIPFVLAGLVTTVLNAKKAHDATQAQLREALSQPFFSPTLNQNIKILLPREDLTLIFRMLDALNEEVKELNRQMATKVTVH